jgi:anti-sigma-K factor RskA
MIDDRQEELASLHAFDLLEGAEREQFEAELRGNPELGKRVAELRGAVTALAHVAPEAKPPEALKARVLASVAARAGGPIPDRKSAKVIAFPTWAPWLMAASIALASLWAERQYASARSENTALDEQRQAAQRSLARIRTQLEVTTKLLRESDREVAQLTKKIRDEGNLANYKIATLASMLGNTPSAVAVAVWDPSREQGILTVSKLPALASEKDYQLWVIDAAYPSPVNAGTFVVDPVTGEAHIVFKADRPVNAIAKFAVSLERKGGVPKPEGPVVLLSQ